MSTEEVKEEQLDPVEASAYFIHEAHKEFRRLSFSLANKKKHSVSRVLEAVLFEPLEGIELLGKGEQELFDICQEIMYHKGVVLKYAADRAANKLKGESSEQKEK
jgi:hypothetical protein